MAGKSVDVRGAVRRAASARQRTASRPVFQREVDISREAAVLHRLACELLGVCGMALMRFKANPGRRAVAALRNLPPKAHYAGRMLDDANKLAVIHTRWQRKTGYFDQDGHPKVISVAGPAPSFEALCRDCGVHRERERLRKLACSFRMCVPAGSNRLAYLSEITLVTGIPSLMLARAVITVERFLKTCAFNGKPGRRVSESMADRTAVVTLSEDQFKEFAQAMRGILHDFIESSDRRLSAQAARDAKQLNPARRSRPTGVTAFVFRD